MIPSYVYVDGFNLYYGAVKGTTCKWLDLARLVHLMLPKNQILKIKYFTALVSPRPNNPDQPLRQQIYLRALQTIPNLEIIYGHFLTHIVSMPEANCSTGQQRYVNVLKTEEKGSDVNIATHLLLDAYKGCYNKAILISNDSDLVEPIRLVTSEFHKGVIVLNPSPNRPSQEIAKHAVFVKPIRLGVLTKSQFPQTMHDQNGTFSKPSGW